MSRYTRINQIDIDKLYELDDKELNPTEIKRKYALINLHLNGDMNLCCRIFKIERTTLYRLKKNYLEFGVDGIFTLYHLRGKKNF